MTTRKQVSPGALLSGEYLAELVQPLVLLGNGFPAVQLGVKPRGSTQVRSPSRSHKPPEGVPQVPGQPPLVKCAFNHVACAGRFMLSLPSVSRGVQLMHTI